MNIEKEAPFTVMANCILVKGANRSTICDLQRNDVQLIPNELYEILTTKEGMTVTEIKKEYNHQYDTIIDDYFQFLVVNEFILFTSTPSLFPKLPLTWDEPSEITHAILDRSEAGAYDIYNSLEKLDALRCVHIEIRYFALAALEEIKKIADFLDQLGSSIVAVDIVMPYQKGYSTQKLQSLFINYPRLSLFTVYNAPTAEIIPPPRGRKRGYIVYSKKIIRDQYCCGVIDTKLFSVNIKTFTESQQHNSCLNRKIGIDSNGVIKNCPSMPQGFGHINTTPLKEVIAQKDFKKYWKISKDQIEVCRDCEFRHICTDCRAFVENPNDKYSKPLKCGYDPYTNQWSDWTTNPLKQKTIAYYSL